MTMGSGVSAAGGAAGGAGGFAVFTRRGGGNVTTGLAGSAGFATGFRPLAATGVSANDALAGTLMLR